MFYFANKIQSITLSHSIFKKRDIIHFKFSTKSILSLRKANFTHLIAKRRIKMFTLSSASSQCPSPLQKRITRAGLPLLIS